MGSIRARKDTGALFIDFRVNSQRCREQTALLDNTSNRKRLEKLLAKIEEDIALGVFDYARYFPQSRNLLKLESSAIAATLQTGPVDALQLVEVRGATPRFNDFAEVWYAEKEIEWRRSHKEGVREDLDKLLIPQFGEKEVGNITKAEILAFRAQLADFGERDRSFR